MPSLEDREELIRRFTKGDQVRYSAYGRVALQAGHGRVGIVAETPTSVKAGVLVLWTGAAEPSRLSCFFIEHVPVERQEVA